MRSTRISILVLTGIAILGFNFVHGQFIDKIHEPKNNGDNDYRLPSSIIPRSYSIMLELPFDGSFTNFNGTVVIVADVHEQTKEVILHVGNIHVTSTKIVDSSKNPLEIANESYSDVTEKYTILLNSTLTIGLKIQIAIKYHGEIRENMIGFYRSSYIDENDKIKWLAATQFQATHARHAFPCFDEPHLKATFDVRILRSKKVQTLSNMPLIEQLPTTHDMVWDSFATSVVMPTYLVAFVVSDFSDLRNKERNFTVWARPNAIDQAEFALRIGELAVKYFSNLFNENYQIAKMDMVAVPDFAAGAMENWGLITYRETRLLYTSENSSITSKQDVASVIAHECAHMWFGNLVTPQWWGYLWLSEGFARYYQYMAITKLESAWKMDQQFVVEQLQTAFAVDALSTSSPMTRNVSSQGEIGTTGDLITYNKGGSVVRMMELTFGTDVFNNALRTYLKENKYSSGTPEDLFSAIQRGVSRVGIELGSSVEEIMNSWTRQAGYPVLSVNITGRIVKLSQKRFFLRESSTKNPTWWIPVTWMTEKDLMAESTSPKYWLSTESAEIELDHNEDEWIIFNVKEAGFYRVNYDEKSWQRITNVLMSEDYENIHEINRAAIVDDLLNLARAGDLDYGTALTGVSYIIRETNYLPFKAAFNGFKYILHRFEGQPNYDWVKNYSLAMVKYIYEDVGYEDLSDDEHFTILLRKEINELACRLDHYGCIERSQKYFAKWRNIGIPIPKNLRLAAHCAAIKYGTSDDWDFLWQEYLNSNCAADQLVILKALGCSQNKTVLETYLLKGVTHFSESRIRRQDSQSVFSAVYDSGLFGARYIMEFVEKYHATMAKYYGNYDTIGDILSGASKRFSTAESIRQFEGLIQDNLAEFKPIKKSLQDSLELAKYELNWYERNQAAIIKWMKNNANNNPTYTTTFSTPTDEPPNTNTTETTDYLLPTSISPESYIIEVTPHFDDGKFTFDGTVKITTTILKDTNKIVLHKNEINIHSIIPTVDGKPLNILNKTDVEKYNFVIILIEEKLVVGQTLIITIGYEGKLNTAMRGFYRSSYTDDSGKIRWLAATHLEPVGARRMFPCFDEPALKATFVLRVKRPIEYNAISNMPLKSTVNESEKIAIDTFYQTPVMSTYLVALVVSDFASLKDTANDCSIWARPNALSQGQYSLSVMAPLLNYFQTRLNQSYQLPKLDMVALPDFASGAMENWGLLTYKESNMLYDPKNSPLTSKQAIADVISHEISHQWFGDQVSPAWWNYLWLSEGFARYFQYHATANVETEWGLESQFVVEQLHSAFGTDGLASTHPMSHDVYSPTEISSIFDTISYAKSASVIRMIEKTFGSEIFYGALNSYLDARNHSYATPHHLFEAFQNQIEANEIKLDAPINTILESWTSQAGYPVVKVQSTGDGVLLSQKRFYLRNSEENESSDNVWWIPITWATQSNPDFTTTSPKYWLSKKNGTVKLDVGDEWTIFNVQQSGYYRVNYDADSWGRIIILLKSDNFTSIHEVNRASLLDDLLAFGRTGEVDYKTVLSATQYLVNETSYIPWRAAFNGLSYLSGRIKGNSLYKSYKTHILKILTPIYEKLGFEENSTESHQEKILRRYVIDWMCDFEVDSCISKSLQYFDAWKADRSALVPVNLRNTIYRVAMKYGTIDDWTFLWTQYLSASVTTEKVVILSALGHTPHSMVLDTFLSKAITEDPPIRRQDSQSVFSSVYSSGLFGAEYTLDYVRRNHAKINQYYGDNSTLASIIGGLSSYLSTKELVAKFDEFVKSHETILPTIHGSMKNHLARAYEELAWYDTKSPEIFEWLDRTYEPESYRLPKTITPTDYDIFLKPDLESLNFTFNGEVRINMDVHEITSKIVLLASDLTIDEISVTASSTNPIKVLDYTIDPITHKFTIYLDTNVEAGSKLNANITYLGILNDEMQGFYRSSYVDENGKTRWLASTQFEPVYARRAFPCFDEPAFKANFRINIERSKDFNTLSNMPLKNSSLSSTLDRVWDHYEESVQMSPYLVAFVVSDFKPLNTGLQNFTVWGRPNAVQYGSYASTIGPKVLAFLEKFTGVDYPIEKMDMVAVPDFAAGAMENWGLITYREYGLFRHENVTSAKYKKYLTTVVAHEIVHMWFGNLVTCEWWDYIWLHEGFAEYLQWIVSDHIEPEWNLDQQFVVYELQSAMAFDATSGSHPMNNNVEKPTSIANSFDKIAYAKSASVLRMLHNAFGSKVFESGLRTYLEANKYKSAHPDNLTAAIQLHENRENSLGNEELTIKVIVDSWTNKAGYPVVTAKWTSGSLHLVQERFLLERPNVTADEIKNPNYWIPLTITTKSQINFTDTSTNFWFGTESADLPLALQDNDWFLINVREIGYYRVNYDEDSWDRLIAALKTKSFDGIHQMNRAQIIDDIYNLARTDYTSYHLALSASEYMVNEEDHLPWAAFFNAVNFIYKRLSSHDTAELFTRHVLSLVENIYKKIGFHDLPNDNQLTELNRELILRWTCKLGHPECVKESIKLFEEWRTNEVKWISRNARSAVYCTAIKHGYLTEWEFLWKKYEETEFSSEKITILNALGCSRNSIILQLYLRKAISADNAIRDQDVKSVFSSVYDTDSFGVDVMLDFIINHYKELREYYGNWDGVGGLVSSVADNISTRIQIEKLQIWISESSDEISEITDTVKSSIFKAKYNLAWSESHEVIIQHWLTQPRAEPSSAIVLSSSFLLIFTVVVHVFA